MPINKIVFGGTTLLDLSNSTLDETDDLLTGVTGYDRTGTLLTGTNSGSAIGVIYQDENGYVVLDDGEPNTRSISITQNGTYSVAGYGSAVVNVAGGGVSVSVETLPGGGEHYIISGTSGGSQNVEKGSFTLASDFALSATPAVFTPIKLSFKPDYFCMIMDNASWDDISTPGAYAITMIGRDFSPPLRLASNGSTDSLTCDYAITMMTNVTTSTDVSSNGYAINGVMNPGQAYQERFYFDTDGYLYVGRYSTATTTIKAGTYNFVAAKFL